MEERDPYPVRDISVKSIKVGDRLRTDDKVDDLLESIPKLGLLNPIVVSERPGQEGYDLVAGRRRLLAVCQLGWAQVPATVMPAGADAKVAEVIENLHRSELGMAERAVHLQAWREYLEATGQATKTSDKHSLNGKKGMDARWKRDVTVTEDVTVRDPVPPVASLVIAKELNTPWSTVRDALAIGKTLNPEVVPVVKDTPADVRPVLKEIAKLPAEKQVEAAKVKVREKTAPKLEPKPEPVKSLPYDTEGVKPGSEGFRCQLYHHQDPKEVNRPLTVSGKAALVALDLANYFDKDGAELLLTTLLPLLANSTFNRVVNCVADELRRRGLKFNG